jgi:hypothetical protein
MNTSGSVLVDSLPCGNGTARQAGSMSAQLNLNSLGSATLASIASPGADNIAHTNRDIAPQASSCTLTSGDGCIRASHVQRVGSIRIGALPAALSALGPVGFTSLLKIDGYNRKVTAEAGYGNANPSVTDASGGTSMGTVAYWNGVGYTTLNIGTGASATIPLSSVVVTNGLTSTTISIGGSVRSGATSAAACASPCAASTAQAESPVVSDIRYTVVVGGVTVADLNIHVDLGTLLAHAEYTPGA